MNKKYNKILEAINKGIQIALDDYQDIETNKSISQYNDVINSEENIKNLIELNKYTVDLGLPSGTRWCKYNLGVNPNKLTSANDWYGDYYAWGEIETKEKYDQISYKHKDSYNKEYDQFKFNKYYLNSQYQYNDKPDNLEELQLEDDAAYQHMHFYNFKFKIPTLKHFKELIKYTLQTDIKNYQGINGLNGRIFKGKNGNELFIPKAGFYMDDEFRISDSLNSDGFGFYWSSTLGNNEEDAWNMYLEIDEADVEGNDRYKGYTIRPILF